MNLFDFLPNFLIIGAAKTDIITLYDLLKQYPRVFLPYNDEAILQELNTPHEKYLLMHRANEFSIDVILPQYLESLFPDQDHSV